MAELERLTEIDEQAVQLQTLALALTAFAKSYGVSRDQAERLLATAWDRVEVAAVRMTTNKAASA
jgi:hypothetical protein